MERSLVGLLEALRITEGNHTSLYHVCAWCQRVQSKDGTWREVPRDLRGWFCVRNSRDGRPVIYTPTHGICPDCMPGVRDGTWKKGDVA